MQTIQSGLILSHSLKLSYLFTFAFFSSSISSEKGIVRCIAAFLSYLDIASYSKQSANPNTGQLIRH